MRGRNFVYGRPQLDKEVLKRCRRRRVRDEREGT